MKNAEIRDKNIQPWCQIWTCRNSFNMWFRLSNKTSNDDSSHNKAEPIQSYGVDAISDGGDLEYKEEIDGLMEHEMAFEEHEYHELELMKFNAFKVYNELTSRMDVVPKPNGFMKS